MFSSHYRLQAAAILLYFSFHVSAIPVEKDSAQLLGQRDADTYCAPNVPVPPSKDLPWQLPGVPKGHYLWIQSSPYTLDDEDDDDPNWEPGTASAKRSLTGRSQAEVANVKIRTESEESLLDVRAPLRPWERANYRDIAAQSGVIMVHTVSGALGNAGDIQSQLPIRAWAGDHVFELNMLKLWLDFYNNNLLKYLLTACHGIKEHFTNILNSVTNLVGVDSVLNGLKYLVLQKKGPRSWTAYPPSTYLGLRNYLQLMHPHYSAVVQELAASFVGLRQHYPQLPHNIGTEFIKWATGRYNRAVGWINEHASGQGFGPDFHTIPGPNPGEPKTGPPGGGGPGHHD